MLVRFSVENWMSFRDPVTLSMVATRERQHGHRVPKIDTYGLRILPIATIYGGNASGKTNLFKALSFARTLVVRGTQPGGLIQAEPFKLDSQAAELPCRFNFEILVDEIVFGFSFSVTRKAVLEERLVRIHGRTEEVLYHRKDGKPNFGRSLKKVDFLRFAFQGTRDNQLFLTNSVSQKVDAFKNVYDWFNETLVLVAPDSRFEPFGLFLNEEDPLYCAMSETLYDLDTGITRLASETVSLESIRLPENLKEELRAQVKEDTAVGLRPTDPNSDYFIVAMKDGDLIVKRLCTYHPTVDHREVRFDLGSESDGSKRILDLLPAFLELSQEKSRKVYVIDELDRSLHSVLTRQLLEMYLNSCSSETRSQLLMTTHDVLLMDQDLLRRDEMWVTERNASGISALYSFSEFKDVRYDKDIRKSYLQGRLGGIPRILLRGCFPVHAPSKAAEGKCYEE